MRVGGDLRRDIWDAALLGVALAVAAVGGLAYAGQSAV